jgi:DNA-binding MarR family transcriptional regulator
MKNASKKLEFFLNLTKMQAVMSRTFEGKLGGVGYTEFVILYHLSQAKDEKMRRIDLANKVGLTASGITRLLMPMEKIGLIQKEANAQDARVSLVMLASGGKQQLLDRLEDAEYFVNEIVPKDKEDKVEELSNLIVEIGKAMAY